jgi:hypothetical protein
VHLDGCVEVEAAYYSGPPGWIGRRVRVQWNTTHVRLIDPLTGQLLREHMIVAPDGSFTGLVPDVIREAGQRRGLHLKWVPLPDPTGLDSSIASGVVDIWGIAAITPERLTNPGLYLTQEWLTPPICIISLTPSNILRPADLARRTLARLDNSIMAGVAERFLAGSKSVPKKTRAEVARAVCGFRCPQA